MKHFVYLVFNWLNNLYDLEMKNFNNNIILLLDYFKESEVLKISLKCYVDGKLS